MGKTVRLFYRSIGRDGETWPEWVRKLQGVSGVYIIKSRRSGQILYVGKSVSRRLYGTLTRHFQKWKGNQAGVTYRRSDVKVAVRILRNSTAVDWAEKGLINRFHPRDNSYLDEDYIPF